MALPQCTITGTLYDNAGDPLAYGQLIVVRVTKDGQTIIRTPQTITANASGVVSFTLPRASVAYLFANADGYDRNGPAGVGVAVPDLASATLGTLELSYGTVPVLRYLPVKDEGTLVTSAPTSINFVGSGVAVTESSGDVTVTVSGGGGSISDGDKGDIVVSGSGATWSIDAGVVTNTHISASAAIAYSKLNLTGAILNADLAGSIANAKLANSAITIAGTSTSLGGSISLDAITGLASTGIIKRTGANTLAAAVAGTDYAPATSGSSILYGNGAGGFSNATVSAELSFSAGTLGIASGGVTNTMLAGSIALTKLATVAASRVLVSDGSGNISASSVTNTTLGYLDATSSVQTQLDAKQATLVSGTNIKTINSTSILGSGDITVSASAAGSSGDYQINNGGSFGAGVLAQASGRLTATPTARSSGAGFYFRVITPADTTQTASTESIGAQFGGNTSAATVTRQWAAGALATQRENLFVAPTYSFVSASTLTTAVNLEASSPIAGTNATLTNSIAARFIASAATHVPLVVRGATSQTGNLFQIENSSGTALLTVGPGSGAGVLRIPLQSASHQGLRIIAASGQSQDLFGITDSSEISYLFSVTAAGHVSAVRGNFSNQVNVQNNSGTNLFGATNGVDSNWLITVSASSDSDKRAIIGPSTATALVLATNNSERARFDSSGLFGINRASSIGAQLHTVSGSASRISGLIEAAASNSAAVLVSKSGSSGTGDLFQAQNSAGTVLAAITSGGRFQVGASGAPVILSGAGSPESAITAPVGSLYLRTDGGASTSIYIKESGTGNTGWVAK